MSPCIKTRYKMYKSTAKETIEEWRESPNSRIEPRCIKRSKPVNTDRVDSKIRIAVTIVQRGRLYRTRLHVVEIWNVARLSGLRWPGVQSSKKNVARGYRFRTPSLIFIPRSIDPLQERSGCLTNNRLELLDMRWNASYYYSFELEMIF